MPDENITPAVGTLAVIGQTPIRRVEEFIEPGAGASLFALSSPAVPQIVVLTPASGSLSIVAGAPAVIIYTGGDLSLAPGAASLSAVGRAPSIVYTVLTDLSITPGAGALSLGGRAPFLLRGSFLALPALVPAELNVDQTVAYAADQFEIALNDSDAFLSQPDLATIDLGFLDDLLAPQLVNTIKDGVVDQIELHVLPSKMATVIRGRDAAAHAIDSTVYVTYSANQSQVQFPPQPESVPGFSGLPVTPGVTVPIVLPGPWRAEQIAKDLCARVGLKCQYGAPDYQLREDVAVNGPVLGVIQSLVDPFSHFERSKVDIWLEGDTLIVRPRGAAGIGITLDAHDTRITNLMVRQRLVDLVRVVRLTGSRTGSNPYFAVDPGDAETETVDEIKDGDLVISRVVTRETKRILDGAVKHQLIETFKRDNDSTSETFGQIAVSTAETWSLWDDLVLTYPNQIVNSPHERVRTTITTEEGVPVKRTRVIHSYDANNFLQAQETISEDPVGFGWEVVKSEIKTYRRNGPNMYQITSTQYSSDGRAGEVHRTTALGSPPGGPGRGFGGGGGEFQGEPITLGKIISTLPGAKDFTVTNASLLMEHLQIILAQAEAASGATEYEINFTAAGIPWIHRGQFIQLTGLTREDGVTPIPLQNSLVSEAKQEYRETSPEPTYLTHVKALFWTP